MIPIVGMLVLVITFVIDRLLGLRRLKVLPESLTTEFGRLATGGKGFDPRQAYRICQQYPCTASNVIRAMLLKIGRPHAEVEHAVNEANEREAARLYANVRWLNLAAAVTPLMGLFGTVWGMINAFYATATLPEGASKAQVLADGIVIALVTTLGGLFVAIPAAIAAHFFEGRIQVLFREIDELLFNLLPQIERFEGKLRVSREQLATTAPTAPPP
ncbi:MAG: MotA/TolQ/ExbB proton channel family protein, partial [Planctomycetales bacterium]|nr:MotA/TolQ/ExbB proton channel family protein [Planctomycetales bacterium]